MANLVAGIGGGATTIPQNADIHPFLDVYSLHRRILFLFSDFLSYGMLLFSF